MVGTGKAPKAAGGTVFESPEADAAAHHDEAAGTYTDTLRGFAVAGMLLCLVVVAKKNGDLSLIGKASSSRGSGVLESHTGNPPPAAPPTKLPPPKRHLATHPASSANEKQSTAELQWPVFGWNTIGDSAAIQQACAPFDALLKAGFHPDNKKAPFNGIPIGYVKKPGKVHTHATYVCACVRACVFVSLRLLPLCGGLLRARCVHFRLTYPQHSVLGVCSRCSSLNCTCALFCFLQNGLGDRLKAILGFAKVAMATGRQLRISVKQDVWDFGRVLQRGVDDVPWNRTWGEYSQRLKQVGGREWKKLPDDNTIAEYQESNKDMFYSANGGDYVAHTGWLEKMMTAQGKGPAKPGDWLPKADMCIARGRDRTPSIFVCTAPFCLPHWQLRTVCKSSC